MSASDITHTVKASVANGRRLFRDDNGVTYWEPASGPVQPETVVAVAPVSSPKRKRRKSEEGDK